MSSDLFRQEALDAQRTRWTGRIIMVRPVTFTFLTFCALLVGLVLVAFAIWGEYTKRSTVQGQLIPISGLVQVYAVQSGIISEKHVYEGQTVQAGDVLYKISLSRQSEAGDISYALQKQIKLKEQSLHQEIARTKNVHQHEKLNLQTQIQRIQQDLSQLEHLLQHQQQRIQLAQNNVKRYQTMYEHDATSYEELELRKSEHLNQVERLTTLQREKNSLQKQLQEQENQLQSLSHQHSIQLAQLAGQSLPTIGAVAVSEQMNNEPLYIVRAKLDKQSVKAYGQEMPLHVGMTLESDILHETRKLYEWVLEPLYSITGKLS